MQRETELERQIYDGTATLLAFLGDLRAGDTLEYSYIAYELSGQKVWEADLPT